MKTDFSFKSLNVLPSKTQCPAPVAASRRKSAPGWVLIRFDLGIQKTPQFKNGTMLTPFYDEANRALLFLSDQRPTPPNARKCYVNARTVIVELPAKDVLKEWFPLGPMRALSVVEASHGRLVVTVANS
jgi:hypothetical protein